MAKNLSDSVEFALNSSKIRALGQRLERIINEEYGVEGYLTDANGYPQLVLEKEGKALVLERNEGNHDSDCQWFARRYINEEEDASLVWKKDIVDAIVWLCSKSAGKPKSQSVSQKLKKRASELSNNDESSESNGGYNNMARDDGRGSSKDSKLPYVKDVFDVVFRIMDDSCFPPESRFDLLNMAVQEYLGLSNFKSLFEDVKKKKETSALLDRLNQLEKMLAAVNQEKQQPAGKPQRTQMSKPASNRYVPEEDDRDEDDSELDDFQRELDELNDDGDE